MKVEPNPLIPLKKTAVYCRAKTRPAELRVVSCSKKHTGHSDRSISRDSEEQKEPYNIADQRLSLLGVQQLQNKLEHYSKNME